MKLKYILAPLFIMTVLSCEKQGSSEPPATAYSEKNRPQFHYSPRTGWMNDPNGMVYFEGDYHLFYQFYPDTTVWGPMHWGHAVSTDLLHWEEKPVALFPDAMGYIFSGSAVFDRANSSGLGTADNPPLVAIFTYHNPNLESKGGERFQTQGVAYSTDGGETWQKYDGNPVLDNPGIRDFRDPKVRWHDATGQWVMTLAVKDRIQFYTSGNVLDWNLASSFGANLGAHGGVWECPDLFPLPFEDGIKWVLLVSINPGAISGGSGTQYFVGDFDGKTFIPEQGDTLWLDHGSDNYAGVTWSNTGEGLFIGWMSNWDYAQTVPTDNWRSAMTLPRQLSLFRDTDGIMRVRSSPVSLEAIKGANVQQRQELVLQQGSPRLFDNVALSNIHFTLNPGEADTVKIAFSNDQGEAVRLTIALKTGIYVLDRSAAMKDNFSDSFAEVDVLEYAVRDKVELQIIKDHGSVELFIDGGRRVMTNLIFPEHVLDRLEIEANDRAMADITIAELRSIW